jgi:hypothetical protein
VRYAASILGVAYAIAAFANIALTDLPDLGDSPADTTAFYAVHSHRVKEVVAAYLGIAAAVLFLLFVRQATAGVLAAVAAGGFAATMIVAQGAFLAPTASISLGYSSARVVDPDFARGASTLGDAVMFGGYALAGVAVVAASTAFATRWLRIVGYALGGLTIAATLTFFPALLLPLWGVVAAIGLAIAARRVAGTEHPSSSSGLPA